MDNSPRTQSAQSPQSSPSPSEDDGRDHVTHDIIGAAMHVHLSLGTGFLEAVYQEALELEFARRGLAFETEVPLPVWYEGVQLRTTFRADFVCEGVVVELKATEGLNAAHSNQILNYLKARGGGRGLLINFGTHLMGIKRLVV